MCNHLLVFNSHLFMLMPPYIYIYQQMYLLLRVNKKIKIKENVVFVYVSLINIMFFVALNTVYASINVFFLWLLIVKKNKFSTCTGQRTHFWCFWWKIYTRKVTGMQTKWNENYVQPVIWKWSTRQDFTWQNTLLVQLFSRFLRWYGTSVHTNVD